MNTLAPRSDCIDWEFVSTAALDELESYLPWINLRVNVARIEVFNDSIPELWDTMKFAEHNCAVLQRRYLLRYVKGLLRGSHIALHHEFPYELVLMRERLEKIGIDV